MIVRIAVPIIFLFLLFNETLFARGLVQKSMYEKLLEVNAEWAEQSDVPEILKSLPELNNEFSMLQVHLMLVENILSRRTPEGMNDAQLAKRAITLNALNLYWKSGGFPINTDHSYRLPIFIDSDDNFCAVGHLLKVTGYESIARKISSQTNYAYVQDMSYDELPSWASNAGLTVEELAWIQPAYTPPTTFDTLNGGVNGVVRAIAENNSFAVLYVAGSFSEADGMQGYNNIARWYPGFAGFDWLTLDSGLNGQVNALLYHNNQLFAGGSFTDAGGTPVSNIAIWESEQWSAAGSLNGPVHCLVVYNGEVYAGGLFDHSPAFNNIAKWNGTDWVSIGESTDGYVLAMENFSGNLIVGGTFSSAGSATSSNIASFNGSQFSDLDVGVPATVRALAVFQNDLYAGGDFYSGTDTFALARYSGSSWEKLHQYVGTDSNDVSINALTALSNKLILAGDYTFAPMVGYIGINLAGYDGAWVDGVGIMDSTVHALFTTGDIVYIGGSFKTASGNTANSITYANMGPSSINSLQGTRNLVTVFPNPANNTVTVTLSTGNMRSVELLDLTGQRVFRALNLNTPIFKLPVNTLPEGFYLIKVIDQEHRVICTQLSID